MFKSPALPLRARNRHKAPVAVVATTLALTLGVPAASFAAPAPVTTAAAPALAESAPQLVGPLATAKSERVKPKLKVKRSSKRQVRGENRVKITVYARYKGKRVPGKIEFRIGKKLVKTKTLKKGKVTYKLPKKLKSGTKKIKVTYRPWTSVGTAATKSGKTLRGTSRTVRVKVMSKSKAIKTEALKHVGVRYRGGGSSPRTGFDCSGFVRYVYKKAGIANLPRSSSAQRHAGKVVSRKKAKVGDIIWTPGHVGIYLGGNKQIDAPRPGKRIKVRSIWQHNPVFIQV